MPSANPTPHPLDAAARDFTPISADEAQSFLAHARKDFTSEDNELGYVPVQPCDLERLSLTILALLAAVERGEADTALRKAAGAAFDEINVNGASEDSARAACNILGPALTAFDHAARAHPPIQETDDAE